MNHGYLEEQNSLLVGSQCTGLGLRAALDGLSVTVSWTVDDQQRVTVGQSASLCLVLGR